MTAKKDILDALSNWNKALSTAKEETHKASLTTEENAREALSNWRKALSGGITKDEETIVQTLAKALQSEGEQSLIADIGLAWLRQLVDQFPARMQWAHCWKLSCQGWLIRKGRSRK